MVTRVYYIIYVYILYIMLQRRKYNYVLMIKWIRTIFRGMYVHMYVGRTEVCGARFCMYLFFNVVLSVYIKVDFNLM